jgi:hypothetical protein
MTDHSFRSPNPVFDALPALVRASRANVHGNASGAVLYHDDDLDVAAIAMPDGRALPIAPGLPFSPSSLGGADDAANLYDRLTQGYQVVHLLPGQTYSWRTSCGGETGQVLPRGFTLYGAPGAGIVTALPNTGTLTPQKCAFYVASEIDFGTRYTILADTVYGGLTVQLNFKPDVGTYIQLVIANGLLMQNYRVLAASGTSSPYTITVDRPIKFLFYENDYCYVVDSIPHPQFHGQGLTFTGPCFRYIECPSTWYGLIEDITMIGTSLDDIAVDQAMSWDGGSYKCVYDRVQIICPPDLVASSPQDVGSYDGIDIESTEGCEWRNCLAIGRRFGFAVCESVDFALIHCQATGCHSGAALVGELLPNMGCREGIILGGHYCQNTAQLITGDPPETIGGHGIWVTGHGGVQDEIKNTKSINIIGAACDDNRIGIYVDGSFTPDDVACIACQAKRNSTAGVRYNEGALRAKIIGGLFEANAYDISMNCSTGTVVGVTASRLSLVGNISVLNVDLKQTTAYTQAISVGAGSKVSIVGGQITMGVNAYGVWCDNAKVFVDGVTFTAGAGARSLTAVNGGTIRQGSGVKDPTAFYSDGVNSYWNRGVSTGVVSVTANGAGTAQDVTWPDIQTCDRVLFITRAIGGTPAGYTYTITAGTKVAVTFASGDTSTYDMVVL